MQYNEDPLVRMIRIEYPNDYRRAIEYGNGITPSLIENLVGRKLFFKKSLGERFMNSIRKIYNRWVHKQQVRALERTLNSGWVDPNQRKELHMYLNELRSKRP